MKHWLLTIITMFGLTYGANATWHGKLDLDLSVQPGVYREIHDGQWLYGVSKSMFHLQDNRLAWLHFHAGPFIAWNAESGNAAFGPKAGLVLNDVLTYSLGKIGHGLGLETIWKPFSLVQEMVTLDFFGGYRPKHTPDVLGNWVYGGSANLRVAFGAKELEAGI